MPPKPATTASQAPAERGDVQTVAGVVLQVVKIHQRGLAQVVVRQLQLADLCGHDGLGARGQ